MQYEVTFTGKSYGVGGDSNQDVQHDTGQKATPYQLRDELAQTRYVGTRHVVC